MRVFSPVVVPIFLMKFLSRCRVAVALLAALFFSSLVGRAQPSGGPYGPIQQRYELPAGAAHTYYVAPDGVADAQGTTLEQPTTLEAALARAVTNDAIILRGGTYRTGRLMFNQGITMQPYADERPVLKGTKVAGTWEAQSNGVWRTAWTELFPMQPESWWRRHREGRKTPLWLFNNDMVFVDGRMLQAVGWEGDVDENSFHIDYDNQQVYIGVDPTNRLVEITAWDGALTRTVRELHGRKSDGKGPTIRGLTLTQYAYRAFEFEGYNPEAVSPESAHGKDIIGTLIEHCAITHCSRVGGYFRGDGLTIRHCLVSDTSTEGIFVLSSNDVLLEKNIIRRNNVEKITGYYPAAVKIFNQCYRVTCRDNLVYDQPNSNGIWYDVGNIDAVFVNNWIQDCEDGFFFEISKGAICAGNVFVRCHKGVRSLNASNVHVYQNTFVNTTPSFERTPRSAVGDHFDWHPASGPGVDEREGHIFVNNLLVGEEGYARELLRFEQTASLCGQLKNPPVAQFDYNVFVRTGSGGDAPLLVWSPAATDNCLALCATLADLHKIVPQFAQHSREFFNYGGPLFQSSVLARYELSAAFPGAGAATTLPEKVSAALGWPKGGAPFVGAYAPRR